MNGNVTEIKKDQSDSWWSVNIKKSILSSISIAELDVDSHLQFFKKLSQHEGGVMDTLMTQRDHSFPMVSTMEVSARTFPRYIFIRTFLAV